MERTRDRGFTLLETVAAAAVAALLLGPLAGFLRQGMNTFTVGLDSALLQERASLALDRFGREVRAHTGAAVTGGTTLQLTGNDPPVTLTLLPAASGSGWRLVADRDGHQEVWLESVDGGGFTAGSNGEVSLTLQLRRGGQAFTLSTTAAPRR